MNDTNAQLASRPCIWYVHTISFIENLAAIFPVYARQNFHQRGFACPVLTDKRMNLTRFQLEITLVQSSNAWKLLIDPFHGDQNVVHHFTSVPSYSQIVYRDGTLIRVE
ncbi:hypothetical protein D3C77_604200 [compost metagenome]